MVTRAYLRISIDTERSGSIEKQRRRISAAVLARGGDPAQVAFYEDRGVSGSRKVLRPGRDRLLSDLQAGDRLIALKVDRLARNVRDLLAIAERCEEVGATLQFVDDGIDTAGPNGRLMLTMLGALAEFEAATTAERVRASQKSFRESGRHGAGKLPVGLRSVPNPDGPGLVVAVDPEMAPKVREAVSRVLAGESQNTVRESLGLSKTGMHKLLTNPRLAGMTPEGDGVLMRDGSPVINEGAAILSMAEWRRLSAFMAGTNKAWSRREGFGRALECGVCSERMYLYVPGSNPAHAAYRCRKVKHAEGEAAPSVAAGQVDSLIEAVFLDEYGDAPYRITEVADDDSDRAAAIAAANVRVSEIERRMRGTSDPEEIADLAQSLVAAHAERGAAEALPVQRREVTRETGRTIREVWAEGSPTFRESLVTAFGRFVVQPGRGRIADRVRWRGLPEVRVNGVPASLGISDVDGRRMVTVTPERG